MSNEFDEDKCVEMIRAEFPNHKIEFVKYISPLFVPSVRVTVDGKPITVMWSRELTADLLAQHGVAAYKTMTEIVIDEIKAELNAS